jgi:hypothetical protein
VLAHPGGGATHPGWATRSMPPPIRWIRPFVKAVRKRRVDGPRVGRATAPQGHSVAVFLQTAPIPPRTCVISPNLR